MTAGPHGPTGSTTSTSEQFRAGTDNHRDPEHEVARAPNDADPATVPSDPDSADRVSRAAQLPPGADAAQAASMADRAVEARAAKRRARIDRLTAAVKRVLSVWTRSLRLRILVLTLVLSALVIVGIGLVIQQQITERLLASKIAAAVFEVDTASQEVARDLQGANPDRAELDRQVSLAQGAIGRPNPTAASGSQGGAAGVFDPVVIAVRTLGIAAGPENEVPQALRDEVASGRLAYQYVTVVRDERRVPALIVGAPAETTQDIFGVYLIFPLTSEQQTVAVVQRTLFLGGVALAGAMSLIAAGVAAQAIRPIRRAASVAERLAAGALDERMPVRGAIELSTMARSFNAMAEAIRLQIRQLEEFGRLQRRFTSDVSHELRTPVTTVRMAADLLHAERGEFPAHLSRATELLVDELDRFEVLLADLLEISRHDAGMAELNAEPVDIRSPLRSSIAALEPVAAKAGVSVEVLFPDEPVVAEVDARRFERIIRNLVGNAIDHAEGQPVTVELAADDDSVAVAVTDRGVGLKPGEAGLVFNRFWRADPSRQRQTGGTGLGLAISLEDARLHGGWLQASGKPGVGSRFRLTLPRVVRAEFSQSPLTLGFDAEEAAGVTGLNPDSELATNVIIGYKASTLSPRLEDPR